MNVPVVQFFFLIVLAATAAAGELQIGARYALRFTDIDGRQFSTSDGRTTVLTVVNRTNQHDARVVGDRVPRQFYGDPKLKFGTIADVTSFSRWLQPLARRWLAHRLELEVQRLRPVYRAKGSNRDPHEDVFIVPDLDGSTVAQFGVQAGGKKSSAFVFAPDGRLVARWHGPPLAAELATAIEAAQR